MVLYSNTHYICKYLGKTSNSALGPPVKNFLEVGDRTKRRKVGHLRKEASAEELAFAAEMNFRETGREDAAKLIHEVALTTPTRPTKIRMALKEQPELRSLSPEEALITVYRLELLTRDLSASK